MNAPADMVGALVALVSAAADESAQLMTRADAADERDAKDLRRQAAQWGELADAGAIALSRFRSTSCCQREPSTEIPVLAIGME